MKCVILILCALVVTVPALSQWRRNRYFHECLDEYELTKDEYKQLLSKRDIKAGCVMACSMEKKDEMIAGLIDEKSMLRNMEHVVKNIGPEPLSKILHTCRIAVEDVPDKCEKALKMRTCRQKELWRLRTTVRFEKRATFKQCLNQNNLTREEFVDLKKSADPRAGCVIACVMEKKGELNDGQLNKGKILKNMPNIAVMRIGKNKLSVLVDTCIAEADDTSDKCEKALTLKTCKRRELWKLHTNGVRRRSSKEQCLKAYGLTREEYRELQQNDDIKAGKVLACIMKKKGQMIDGKFDFDAIVEYIHRRVIRKIGKDKLYEIVSICADKADDLKTKTEKVMAMKKCLRTAIQRELENSQ